MGSTIPTHPTIIARTPTLKSSEGRVSRPTENINTITPMVATVDSSL